MGIYYSNQYESKDIHHPVGTITQINNNTYQATIQCLGPILQNVTKQCGDNYDILIECSTFPSKKVYTEIQFICDNMEFIKYLENNTGGKQTETRNKHERTISYILWGMFGFAALCSFLLFVGVIGSCVLIWVLIETIEERNRRREYL